MTRSILFVLALALALQGGLLFTKDGMALNENSIVLSKPGMVVLTVYKSVTNLCNGDLGINSPEYDILVSDYNNNAGYSTVIGPFEQNTELVFFIRPWSFCEGYEYLSTDLTHAKVTPLEAPDSWRIDWEDMPDILDPDGDFDDLVLIVRLESSVPDFKQDHPDWELTSYASLTHTLGGLGSGVSSAANVLNYFGAYEVDPQTLNSCLENDLVAGYLEETQDPDCQGADSSRCDAGAIRWSRLGVCSNPIVPGQPPFLLKWAGVFNLNDLVLDSVSEQPVLVTEEYLLTLLDQDLNQGWPAVLQVAHPSAPDGNHHIVAVEKSGETYIINDPYCGDWPICSSSRSTLADFGGEVKGLIRFAPNDKVFQRSLLINVFSPVDLMLIDPSGRRIGSTTSGNRYAEIPQANAYFRDPLANLFDNNAHGDGFREIYVLDPITGTYEIQLSTKSPISTSLLAEYHNAPLNVTSDSHATHLEPGRIYRLRFKIDDPTVVSPVMKFEVISELHLPLIFKR